MNIFEIGSGARAQSAQSADHSDKPVAVEEIYLTARKLRAQKFRRLFNRTGARLSSLVTSLADWLQRRSDQRNAIDRLMGMDDRLLADIGLTRGEIESAVVGKYIFGGRHAAEAAGHPANSNDRRRAI